MRVNHHKLSAFSYQPSAISFLVTEVNIYSSPADVARELIIAKTSRHPQAQQPSCRHDGFFRRDRLWSLPTTNDLTAFPQTGALSQHSQQQRLLSKSTEIPISAHIQPLSPSIHAAENIKFPLSKSRTN